MVLKLVPPCGSRGLQCYLNPSKNVRNLCGEIVISRILWVGILDKFVLCRYVLSLTLAVY